MIPFVMVEGNAELTPARLIGHFDPALVLTKGYVPDIFEDGPLLEAMRTGGLLYVEELNRIPEETLNVLLTAMSELEITVPRLGRVAASPGFALVAAMNPFDAVGTARVSGALYDRTCRISMDYQTASAEEEIVGLRSSVDPTWRAKVVELVRRTRSHPDIRFGSSVRGAIDISRLGVELAKLRERPTDDWHVGLAAAKAALSGRIRLHDGCDRTPEQVVTELYVGVFGAEPSDSSDSAPEGSPGETLSPPPGAGAPPPSARPESRQRKSAPRTTGRSDLAKNPRFAELSPEVGELDLEALDDALGDDPDDTLTLLVEMSHATDEGLRRAVRRLAPRLILDQTRRGIPRNRGVSKPRPVRATRGGDLDLDRSMDAIVGARAEARMPSLDEMTAVDWARPELALCLVIDHSGSMNGHPPHHRRRHRRGRPDVRPRGARGALVRRGDDPLEADVRHGRGHGHRGAHPRAARPRRHRPRRALSEAQAQLAGARARRRVTILLSDCRVTDEVDATPAARALDELVILAPAGDDDEAQRLARDSGARIASIGSVLDVPAPSTDCSPTTTLIVQLALPAVQLALRARSAGPPGRRPAGVRHVESGHGRQVQAVRWWT